MSDKKVSLPGQAPERVFMATINNLMNEAARTKFVGVVDVGVHFNAVEMTENGKLVSLLKSGSSKQTSVQVKLATRIHIDQPSNSEE